MSLLVHSLEAFFTWLLEASWQASVLALLVLGLQRLLGSRLNPRWRYALWLLVLVRLLLPSLPESALSLFQFTPSAPEPLVTTITQPWQPLFTGKPYPAPSDPEPMVRPNYPFSWFTLLTLLWLLGASVLLSLTWQVNRRFARQIANSPEITDPDLCKLFAAAQAELGLRRPIRLIENSHVQSPAIMGLFHPTLLLPLHVRDQFDATELRLIFLHELAHLKRGDVFVQGLIALLQILHWFNPVLWYAFRRIRIDREPATDALVLSRAGEAEKERYGLMLIKLMEHFNQRHSLPTLVGILEDKDQFKRRFSLIARFTRGAYGWSLLGVVLVVLLSFACLTAKETGSQPDSTAHNKTSLPPIYVWYHKIGLGYFGPVGHDYSLSDGTRLPGSDHVLSVFCPSFTQNQAKLVFIESWPTAPASTVNGQSSQPTGERRTEIQIPLGQVDTFRIFDSVDVSTSPTLKPDADPIQSYLEATSVETTDTKAMPGAMKISSSDQEWMRENPKNRVTNLDDFPLQVGTNIFQGKTPSGFDFTVTINVNRLPADNPEPVSVKLDWPNANGGSVSYDFAYKESLGPNDCLLITGPWKTKETSKLVLSVVDHPYIDHNKTTANGRIKLLNAVKKGDAATLQKLIDQGLDPSKIEDQKLPLLFWARTPEVAEILLQHGADPNARDAQKDTVLSYLCRNRGKNAAAVAEVLLKHGADPNAPVGELGETPLMDAQDGATVDVLFAHGANPKIKRKDGISLMQAVGIQKADYFEALLRHGVPFDPKTDGPTILLRAAWINNLPMMQAMLDHGVDPNQKGVWAMVNGKPMMMKPMEAAVVDGQLEAAEFLLNHGAQADDQMTTALFNRGSKIVKFFWEHGVHNISELSYEISQNAPIADLQKLLDHGATPDSAQDKKLCPLAIAAQLGEMDAVKLLVDRGADVNRAPIFDPQFPDRKISPLFMAAGEGQDEIVSYLLQHGAKPEPDALSEATENSAPYSDQRPQEHFEKTVRILLDAGALKTATPEMKGLILAGAIGTRQGPPNLTVLKMLLDAGLSPELPMPYLKENGDPPNSIIGYVRDRYQQKKDDPAEVQEVATLRSILDQLEAADEKPSSVK